MAASAIAFRVDQASIRTHRASISKLATGDLFMLLLRSILSHSFVATQALR
jgi:hypothetical protein